MRLTDRLNPRNKKQQDTFIDGLKAVALPLSDLRKKRGVGIEPTCHK